MTPADHSSPSGRSPLAGEPSPHLISGFGTLMEKERELLALMQSGIDEAQGPNAPNLIRILNQHLGQIGVIIGLIEQRQGQLPQPGRFGVSRAATEPTHPPGLLARHQILLNDLESLVAAGGRSAGHEPLLREAIQRHEDMAWMLTALIREDGGAGGEMPLISPFEAD